ncbi:MAG: type IVB secretion system protein IcmJDotN [Proteobacteria bacterium]|nr:type IVB secretion system protein IcmJDotN [Pseudomonadota bacterium]
MELLPITITAQRGSWRLYNARKRNNKFLDIKKRVLQRDNYTCRYCGFFAKEFQEIVNIDQNYRNNDINNLATACCFCAQCFFLDAVGLDANTGGAIIHLPEISQSDLNNFCRVLYCSMDKESAYKGKLQSVYMSFKDRSKEVVNCFGPDSSDPRVFGQGLLDASLNKEQLQHDVLRHLRLLPSKKAFTVQIDYWKKTVFAKVPL